MFPKIENYTIQREIGTGGMAVVYEATDERLHRPVAIKILHPHLSKELSASDRFLREARAAARIDHPNVVRIYDFGESNSLSYIIMEYVPGTNAETQIKEKGPLPADTVISIMVEIAVALAQAHAQGMIHRDVKPANILLHKQGRAMLTDFGLAHRLPDPRLTSENAVAGTPSFMAPEQLAGKTLSPAADIYSWGVCFYALVTGALPYRRQEFPDILSDIRHGAIELDSGLLAKMPPWCYELLHRCLCADPSERIRNATELLRYMRSVGKGVTTPGDDPATVVFDTTSADSTSTASATVVLPRRDIPSGKRLSWMVMVVFFLLATGGGVLYIIGNRAKRADQPERNSPSGVRDDGGFTGDSALRSTGSKELVVARTADDKIVPVTPSVITGPDQNSDTIPPPSIRDTGTIPHAPQVESSDTELVPAVVDSGRLFIHCNPWAEVYIEERKIGTTPLPEPVALPVGEHRVRLVNEFCDTVIDTVKVVAGEVTRKRYTLTVRRR
jgi:eukaryotic-like serine/threonine-protein kinase